ncbi:hypothetical protein [Paenimyroides ceti]
MKKTFTILSLCVYAASAQAQVQDSIAVQAPVYYEAEVDYQVEAVPVEAVQVYDAEADAVTDANGNLLDQLGYDFYATAEMDTIVKYRREIFPFVRAGFGNLSKDHQFAHSDFGYMRSTSFQWGFDVRQPFSKEKNLLGLRYGVSFSYNSVAPTDNRIFVVDGNKTVLEPAGRELRKGRTFFRNSYVEIPIALDFDFSTKTYNHANRKFVKNNKLNFGLGGYVGYNINSKQFLSYRDDVGNKVSEKVKGKWNVEDFNYGVMAYIGSRNTKIYAKYDLAPVFKNNDNDMRYWSLGLQLDLR